jgi:hypothetical protein
MCTTGTECTRARVHFARTSVLSLEVLMGVRARTRARPIVAWLIWTTNMI